MIPALQTRALTIGYRRHGKAQALLDQLDLAVAPGELVSLLGRNGAGKSTLLRTLARSQPPLFGSVLIRGQDAARLSAYDLARAVGVLLTERLAFAAMPALRLVELGRYPHTGWSGSLSQGDRTIVAEAIAAVGAQHLAQRDMAELSDGERQRIMIARALAQRPAVLLLDEPTAYLDVSARVEMFAMLRHLAREQNVAIILSSHDLDLSLRLSDTVWLIDKANRLIHGAPEDLLSGTALSAAFSSNAIDFSLTERSFRILSRLRGEVFVSATGAERDLLRTVLEREGYGLTDEPNRASFSVLATAEGWTLRTTQGTSGGSSYADLAHTVRSLDENPVP
ncbi:iron complex transport system ATP-binding protein [Devosia crocina]|uniref:Iron complex transport system ATP-binding protein n=1 Tax=Devosia crocina TaxID=429728 RepID=A0A1I7N2T9_9HYPH|nr:ATP-binding cassette domain-containing protein [Devosia crocina]SFV28876.1 iron complex transport system ATP-binding protein [Devosia crocina]